MSVFSARRVGIGLAVAIAALTIASIFAQLQIYVWEDDSPVYWRCHCAADFFDAGQERNLPTWYSGLALLGCAALLARLILIAAASGDRRDAARWAFLSVLFLYLFVDELTEIHEYTSWLEFFVLIPAGVVIAATAAGFVRFFFSLAPRIRRLFISAGALYVCGAIVMEGIDNLIIDHVSTVMFAFYDGVLAELFEMLGVAIFIYALLLQIESLRPSTPKGKSADPDPEFVGLIPT